MSNTQDDNGAPKGPTQEQIDESIARLAMAGNTEEGPSAETISSVEDHIIDAVNLVGPTIFLQLVAGMLGTALQSAYASINQQAADADPRDVQLMIAKANQFGHASNVIGVAASILDGMGLMLHKTANPTPESGSVNIPVETDEDTTPEVQN
jgi:hypothetical protein